MREIRTGVTVVDLPPALVPRDTSWEEWHSPGVFAQLLEAVPTAIYTTDAKGRITFYNRAATQLWGCSSELGHSEF